MNFVVKENFQNWFALYVSQATWSQGYLFQLSASINLDLKVKSKKVDIYIGIKTQSKSVSIYKFEVYSNNEFKAFFVQLKK